MAEARTSIRRTAGVGLFLQFAVCVSLTLASETFLSEPPATAPESPRAVITDTYAIVPCIYPADASIEDIMEAFVSTPGGPELAQLYQTLVTRKDEALPHIRENLRSGDMWDKHMMTKLLCFSPSVEAYPELLSLALAGDEHWLPRQGALYALGALGNPAAGAEVVMLLADPNCPPGVQTVAIATLARLGYRQATDAILPFADHEDVHLQLFAMRALAEFGEPVDYNLLLAYLEDTDYVVRQEACGALAAIETEDVDDLLEDLANTDGNEAVRTAARIALLERKVKGQSPQDKLSTLGGVSA